MGGVERGSRAARGGEIHSEHRIGALSESRPDQSDEIHIEHRLARLAAPNRGLVTRQELLGAGFTRRQIERRLAVGRLHLIHPGVYAVGHPALPPHGRERAAVLWAGPEAAISHRSAAVLWNLLHDDHGPIHITKPPPNRKAPDDVILHRVTKLPLSSLRSTKDLQLTDPARTLQDLAAHGNATELARAVNEAQVRRLVTPDELKPQRGSRGAARLRAVIDEKPTPTRSKAERRLVSLILKAQLPRPQTNARVGRYEVDALWPEHRLVVETDGFAAHGTRAAFEKDRRRDAELQAAGYAVMRVTWREIEDHPTAVAARLAAALARRDP